MPRDGSDVYHIPPGTEGEPDTTIESAKYNAFLADLEQDLNAPRPIIAGGTGATNAAAAMAALSGELTGQVVTNYDSHLWRSGSFLSLAGATSAPVTGHAFTGIVYKADDNNLFIEASDQDEPSQPGGKWVRQKKAGVWSLWAKTSSVISSSTVPVGAADNSLWWDPNLGRLFIRFNDGNSTQWVEAVATPDVDATTFVEKAGDTMLGPLVLAGNPAAALQAAPKQYVDLGDVVDRNYADGVVSANAVYYSGAQSLADANKVIARKNIYAAPFDAFGYSGLQVNGAMEIAQGGSPSANVVLNPSSSAYIADQWNVARGPNGGFNGVWYASGGPPGLPNCIAISCTTPVAAPAAGDFAFFRHPVEAYRWQRLSYGNASAAPVTIGFWVYSTTITGNLGVSIRHYAGTRSYATTVPISAASVWEYKTITIPGDTANFWSTIGNVGLAWLSITPMAGSTWLAPTPNAWSSGNYLGVTGQTNFYAAGTNIVYIAGVSILPGNEGPLAARSPYIFRGPDLELAACKRYYNRMAIYPGGGSSICAGVCYSATLALMAFNFPEMRDKPTLDISSAAHWAVRIVGNLLTASAVSLNGTSPTHTRIDVTTSGLAGGQGCTFEQAAGAPVGGYFALSSLM